MVADLISYLDGLLTSVFGLFQNWLVSTLPLFSSAEVGVVSVV